MGLAAASAPGNGVHCFHLVTKERHPSRLQPAPLSQPACSPGMAARATGLQRCWGHPEGAAGPPASPIPPGTGRQQVLAGSSLAPRLGTPPVCLWLPWVGLARHALDGAAGPAASPAGHAPQREHHLNEALRHCCYPWDVTAEILPVCRPASAASARLRWLPARRERSLHGCCRCPARRPPCWAPLPSHAMLGCIPSAWRRACTAQVQRDKPPLGTRPRGCPKASVPWGGGPRGRCGNGGDADLGWQGVVGAGLSLWLLG